MIRVGVIADTHDILKEEVLNELKQCDYIIHAGDIVDIKNIGASTNNYKGICCKGE